MGTQHQPGMVRLMMIDHADRCNWYLGSFMLAILFSGNSVNPNSNVRTSYHATAVWNMFFDERF